MNKITISKLPAKRWREYKDLRLEALKKEPMAFNRSYEEAVKTTSKEWKKRLSKNPDPFLFVLVENKPIGLLQIVYEKPKKLKHVAWISQFYLKRDYRGKGIGKKLLEEAINIIKNNKKTKVLRVGVYESQQSAIRLYKKLGFKIIGKYQKGIKVDNNYYNEILFEMLL